MYSNQSYRPRPVALVAALISTLVFSACGTFKTHDRNVSEVNQIKRAALVAFMADLPARSGISVSMNSGKASGKAGGSMIAKSTPTAEEMATKISQTFGTKMGWKMTALEKMRSAPIYIDAYKRTMDGWQNKMPPGEGTNRHVVQNVMDADSLRIMGSKDRELLMNGLDVDALIVARVNVLLNGTTVMGIGNRYPQTKVFFQVYKRGVEDPVWFETLEGKEMTESVGKTQLTLDEDKVAKLSVQSLEEGMTKLQ